MEVIQVKDRRFKVSLTEEEILKKVAQIGKQINEDHKGKEVVFLCVLNGAFMFASDLLKHIDLTCEISFIRLASYTGLSSSGKVQEVIGINQDLKNKTVIVIEDIIDSGLTMQYLLETLKEKGAKEVNVAALLVKYDNLKVPLDIAYECFSIPNDFIIGYGLDYDGQARNLRNIYTVVEE